MTTTQTGSETMAREILEGLNGSGAKTWNVFTLKGSKMVGIETFDTLAEAEHWVKWA